MTSSLSTTEGEQPTNTPSTTEGGEQSPTTPTPVDTTAAAATPAGPCPPPWTLVDGHCYRHVSLGAPADFAAADGQCGLLAAGGRLASLHTARQLEFCWHHPSRPAAQQWVGLELFIIVIPPATEFRNSADGSRPDIAHLEELIEGDPAGWCLSLPADRGAGRLLRTSGLTRLSAAVCERPAG
ncbi:hypothetical protein FJT64_002477 [Amphibalanus amphitrite]|uniref:C-type lectin domain-containing protein n=1 Tax=Amphibalanus amphitrite TaxID=1232801 RepID=A0A6A4WJ19_AMPAM|nr:hypothetical protein FJT64_002477 [Amphibalanus amphitrite]